MVTLTARRSVGEAPPPLAVSHVDRYTWSVQTPSQALTNLICVHIAVPIALVSPFPSPLSTSFPRLLLSRHPAEAIERARSCGRVTPPSRPFSLRLTRRNPHLADLPRQTASYETDSPSQQIARLPRDRNARTPVEVFRRWNLCVRGGNSSSRSSCAERASSGGGSQLRLEARAAARPPLGRPGTTSLSFAFALAVSVTLLFAMSSPYRHGPSGVSDPNPNSTSRPASSNHHRFTSPFSPIFSGSNYFYTHPARTSLLNPSGELIVERDSSLEPRTGSGLDLSAARDSQPPAWMAGGALPSFSRAFDVFTMDDIADKSVDGQDGRFFVPSYLQTSTYVQELQVAHRMKTLAQDDSDRSDDRGPPKNLLPGYPPSTLPPGSHRGMSHTIIERPPRFSVEDDETLTPLPTRWNRDDCWGSLDIGTNGTSIKYNDTRNHNERDHEAYAVRADHHIPPQCGIYYFEVHVLASKRDEYVWLSLFQEQTLRRDLFL